MKTCRLLFFALLSASTLMIFALVVFAAVFIDSNEVTISPFNFCLKGQRAQLSCEALPSTTGVFETIMIISRTPVILCLYVPLVLVLFALLSLAYADKKNSSVLRLSMWCQAASSALSLVGLVWFVGLHWAYATPSAMTPCYYCSVLVTAQLALTTYLSSVLLRKLDHQQ